MSNRRLTIADVAKRAGVSTGLVSFALNGRPGVSQETRERILAVAAEMGWQPSMRARALSTSRSLAYGLVINRDPTVLGSDSFYPPFIAGIERAISRAGHVLVLSVVSSVEEEFETYRSLIETGRVDGVFLTDVRRDDARVALIEELGSRAVVIGYPDADSRHPVVAISDQEAGDDLIEHLAELAHTDIGLVMGPDNFLHAARWRDDLLASMRKRGMRVPRIIQTDFSSLAGVEATRELLDDPNPPTAIVYANDNMAYAALGYVQRAGYEVPLDLSISGWIGSEATQFAFPSLTTVSIDIPEWGFRAAEALMATVAGRPVTEAEPFRSTLTVRESTGRARTAGAAR